MSDTRRRKRHRTLALIAAAAVAVLVGAVCLGVWIVMRLPDSSNSTEASVTPSPSLGVPTAVPPNPRKPRPEFQDASCPDVMTLSIPGTWESSPQLDPKNPVDFPIALLLNVTNPLRQAFGDDRLSEFTVPYTAQFRNPFAGGNQMTYDKSRKEGTDASLAALTDMNNRCPLTSYVIVGFSQGAVIAGDIASAIGNGKGPVDADLVLGVMLIADGRRQAGVGHDVGPNPDGEGAEITLAAVPMVSGTLSGLGLTMTGPRPGGFGELNDRTNEICGTGDLICAAPQDAFSFTNLPKTLEVLSGGAGQPVHALYNTPEFWNIDGAPAPQWTLGWAQRLVDAAPHPKHG